MPVVKLSSITFACQEVQPVVAPEGGMVKSSKQVPGGIKRGASGWSEKAVGFSRFSGSKGEENGGQQQLLLPGSASQDQAPSPAPQNWLAAKIFNFHGPKSGLVAQWQSGRLITGWSQVRTLPSPPVDTTETGKRDRNPSLIFRHIKPPHADNDKVVGLNPTPTTNQFEKHSRQAVLFVLWLRRRQMKRLRVRRLK